MDITDRLQFEKRSGLMCALARNGRRDRYWLADVGQTKIAIQAKPSIAKTQTSARKSTRFLSNNTYGIKNGIR